MFGNEVFEHKNGEKSRGEEKNTLVRIAYTYLYKEEN